MQNELLEAEATKLKQEIEELQQQLALQERNSVSIDRYDEKNAKCEHLRRKLKEREDELTALWQTSLVARTHFPI